MVYIYIHNNIVNFNINNNLIINLNFNIILKIIRYDVSTLNLVIIYFEIIHVYYFLSQQNLISGKKHSKISETHERETYKVFPTFLLPKLQFTTSCISAHIHITVFQLVSLQSVCCPLLNTITTYLVSFTFICQRAECTTCLPVKSTILSTVSQPWYGYGSSKVRWSKGDCIHNTLRCFCCW